MKKIKAVIALTLCMLFAFPFAASAFYEEGLKVTFNDSVGSITLEKVSDAESDLVGIKNYKIFVNGEEAYIPLSTEYTGDVNTAGGKVTINADAVKTAVKKIYPKEKLSDEVSMTLKVMADCDNYGDVSSNEITLYVTVDGEKVEVSSKKSSNSFLEMFQEFIKLIKSFFKDVFGITL